MKIFLHNWKVIRDYCIGWTFACIFLSIVRGIGTIEIGILQFGLKGGLLLAVTFGPIIGLISGVWQLILEEKIQRTISIRGFLLLRFFYTIIFLLLLILISYGVYIAYFGIGIGIVHFAFDTGAIVVYFYVLMIDLLLNIFRQVNLMLGIGNLGKLIRGDFYTPKEEERIFMFIDLRSSTKLAEALGNVKYSKFIQDCFNDLSIVKEYKAEIYQYVGDEVVLTWSLKDGLKKQNCLTAFYSFKAKLLKRANYYQSNYGVAPYFKAGANCGKVTIAEVGKLKKEIAYHGDTMNTAARIQGMCNKLQEELLISNKLKELLPVNAPYQLEKYNNILLKGKKELATLYGVKNTDMDLKDERPAA